MGNPSPCCRSQLRCKRRPPNSLEALQAYTTGWKLPCNTGLVDHYQRAIAFDPQFAMAYAMLGITYYGVGRSELAAEYSRKASQLRQRASEPERLFIDYNYERNVTGNLTKKRWASF